jgi:NTP pyrophosphatase (non-canonical NTP hydrolase)
MLKVDDLQVAIANRDMLTTRTIEIGRLHQCSSRALAILYQTNALAGEAGELANIGKKIVRDELLTKEEQAENEAKAIEQGYMNLCDKRTREAAKELADILSYAALCAEVLGVRLSHETVEKFNSLSAKNSNPEVNQIIL